MDFLWILKIHCFSDFKSNGAVLTDSWRSYGDLPAFENWVVALYVKFFVSFSKLIFCIIEEVAPLMRHFSGEFVTVPRINCTTCTWVATLLFFKIYSTGVEPD